MHLPNKISSSYFAIHSIYLNSPFSLFQEREGVRG